MIEEKEYIEILNIENLEYATVTFRDANGNQLLVKNYIPPNSIKNILSLAPTSVPGYSDNLYNYTFNGNWIVNISNKCDYVAIAQYNAVAKNRWYKYSCNTIHTYRWDKYNVNLNSHTQVSSRILASISGLISEYRGYSVSVSGTQSASPPTVSNGKFVLGNTTGTTSGYLPCAGETKYWDRYGIGTPNIDTGYYSSSTTSSTAVKNGGAGKVVMGGNSTSDQKYTHVYFYGYHKEAGTISVQVYQIGSKTGSVLSIVTSSTSNTYPSSGYKDGYWYEKRTDTIITYTKGSTFYGEVISESSSTYPSNGRYSDGYWYVKQ